MLFGTFNPRMNYSLTTGMLCYALGVPVMNGAIEPSDDCEQMRSDEIAGCLSSLPH